MPGLSLMIRQEPTMTCRLRLLLFVSRSLAEKLKSLAFNVKFSLSLTIVSLSARTSMERPSSFKSSRRNVNVISVTWIASETSLLAKSVKMLTTINVSSLPTTTSSSYKNVPKSYRRPLKLETSTSRRPLRLMIVLTWTYWGLVMNSSVSLMTNLSNRELSTASMLKNSISPRDSNKSRLATACWLLPSTT